MNSKNSKTSDPHRLLLNLSDKIYSKKGVINVLLYKILAYTTYGTIYKKSYENNEFKISRSNLN